MRKPQRGPDPKTGAPTYEMIETLLWTFRNTSYRDLNEHAEYMAAARAVNDRRAALAKDAKLAALESKLADVTNRIKTNQERIKARAEAVYRRLLAEGLTSAVQKLVLELVADAEKAKL